MTAFAVADELTIQTAAEQRSALLAALDGTERLEADLSAVNELDTAGLQVLLAVAAEARSAGKTFEVVSPSAAVVDVLELAHLTHVVSPGPAAPADAPGSTPTSKETRG